MLPFPLPLRSPTSILLDVNTAGGVVSIRALFSLPNLLRPRALTLLGAHYGLIWTFGPTYPTQRLTFSLSFHLLHFASPFRGESSSRIQLFEISRSNI